jgi:prolyl-tRNA editing enzyme YbaK/EbsC (Cys-tRNA(Pro) deacylase)
MRYVDAESAEDASEVFATLDRLRVVLDTAAIRRRMLRVEPEERTRQSVAAFLGVAEPDIIATSIVEADGDYLAVLGPGGTRVVLDSVAEAVGAKRVRVAGPRRLRAWLARLLSKTADDAPPSSMEWWEVPFITGLPAVMERSLLDRQFLYAGTGDPGWVARIAPDELRRATLALVADVVRRPAS